MAEDVGFQLVQEDMDLGFTQHAVIEEVVLKYRSTGHLDLAELVDISRHGNAAQDPKRFVLAVLPAVPPSGYAANTAYPQE